MFGIVAVFGLNYIINVVALNKSTGYQYRTSSGNLTINQIQPTISHSNNVTSTGYPSFLRPSINPTPGCDIWGPLCQTGSIVVDVDMKTATTQTTVSCSDYLSAQAQSLLLNPARRFGTVQDVGYKRSFLSSPECTSYANWYDSKNRNLNHVLSFSNCGKTLSKPPEEYLPFQVDNGYPGQYCCGPCAILIDEIRVLFFPEKSSTFCSNNSRSTEKEKRGKASAAPSLNTISKRGAPFQADEHSIAISDGYTFTSPSLYLQIVGTARVVNDCGQVGSIYTNAIVAVPEGGLSTVSLDIPIGSSFDDFGRGSADAYTKSLKVADLMCPTWGLKDSNDKAFSAYTTVGAPFNPIIVPPSQLISLDPSWLTCTSYPNVAWVGFGGICTSLRNEVFDPPRQLIPVAALLPAAETPSVTTASYPHPPTSVPAEPAGIGSPHLPANTKAPIMTSDPKSPVKVDKKPPVDPGDPLLKSASRGPVGSPAEDSADPGHQRIESNPTSPIKVDKNPPVDPGDSLLKSASHGPVGSPAEDSADPGQQPMESNPKDPARQSNPSVIPELSLPIVKPPSDPKSNDAVSALGQIIYNAFNGNGDPRVPKISPDPQAATIDLPTSTSAVTVVAGLMATIINPSVVALAGNMISVGGDPVTISDKVFSLLPSNKLAIGVKPDSSRSFALPMSIPTTMAIAGQLITIVNPSTIVIAGTKLSIGGDAKVIPNKIFSLNSAGSLFVKPMSVDSHVFTLPATTSATVKIADQVVNIINPSTIAIAGTTLSIGGEAKPISNTMFSLNSAGNLVAEPVSVNSHIFALPATTSATVKIADQLINIINPSTIAIAGTTLSIGGEAKPISNTMYSLDSAGNLVAEPLNINFHTFSLPTTTSAAVSLAGQLIDIVNPSTIAIAGTTLVAGGVGKVISNTMFSLNSAGNLVAEPMNIDSLTFSLPTTNSAAVSIAGQLVTIINPSTIAIAGTTLIAGGKPITRSGTTISLGPSNELIIGFTSPPVEGTTTVLPPGISSIFTAAALTFTPISKSGVVVDGQTIFPGAPELSISGRRISLDTHGTLVIDRNSGSVQGLPSSVFPIGLTAQSSPTNVADAADDIRLSRTLPVASSAVVQPTPRNTVNGMDSFSGAQHKPKVSGILKMISSLTLLLFVKLTVAF